MHSDSQSQLGRRSTPEPADPEKPPEACSECAGSVGLIGDSDDHRQLLADLYRVAQFGVEVLLVGPTGVGKERYARYVHECSSRSTGEFVAVNCGAIPESLFENEMFGHSAGAFTDAKTRSEGLVAAANGGTLFLDEIDGLPKSGQVKLLRLLQEKEYRRLGETRTRRADIRVVTAMNRDPAEAIQQGDLREDLFYRLCVHRCEIAPLRFRPDDVRVLIRHFVDRYAVEYRQPALKFTDGALRLLCAYHWPGNVRQLENVIRSLACRFLNSRPVDAADIPITQPADAATAYGSEHSDALLSLPFAQAKSLIVERFEVDYLRDALRRANGNVSQASQLAGKNRRAFFELMRKHGIDREKFTSTAPGEVDTFRSKPR